MNSVAVRRIVAGGAGFYFLASLGLREPQAAHWLALTNRLLSKMRPGPPE